MNSVIVGLLLVSQGVVFCDAATLAPTSTRLAGSGYPDRGRVEVLYNGEWGTVCDDFFGDVDAGVVCYSLGYTRNATALVALEYGPGDGRIWLDDVNCAGTESFIGDCQHRGWGVEDCAHNEDAAVICHEGSGVTPTPTPSTTKVTTISGIPPASNTKLVGSGYTDRGRVEVLHDGFWGTICNDKFEDVDAGVVCYSLGFGRNATALVNLEYGPGEGVIWLDEVNCTGTESFVGDCSHSGWGIEDCSHNEDVAVICHGASEVTPTPTTTTVTPPTDLPSPFTEVELEGTMVALDIPLTMDCLNLYTDQFKLTLDEQLVKTQQELTTLCPAAYTATLDQSYVNMIVVGQDVNINFGVDLTGTGDETHNNLETCSFSVADYLSDFTNWNQPIWVDINGCSRLQFSSTQFLLSAIAWKCP